MTLWHSMERLCRQKGNSQCYCCCCCRSSHRTQRINSKCLNEPKTKSTEKKTQTKNASKRFMTSLLVWNHRKRRIRWTLNREIIHTNIYIYTIRVVLEKMYYKTSDDMTTAARITIYIDIYTTHSAVYYSLSARVCVCACMRYEIKCDLVFGRFSFVFFVSFRFVC